MIRTVKPMSTARKFGSMSASKKNVAMLNEGMTRVVNLAATHWDVPVVRLQSPRRLKMLNMPNPTGCREALAGGTIGNPILWSSRQGVQYRPEPVALDQTGSHSIMYDFFAPERPQVPRVSLTQRAETASQSHCRVP